MALATQAVLVAALVACAGVSATGESRFASIAMAPPDPILGVGVAFNADPAENKVNLGIGAYRDDKVQLSQSIMTLTKET